MAKLGSARFLPFGYSGDTNDLSWSASVLASGAVQVSTSGAASDQITMTGHQAKDGRCGLHIVTSSEGNQSIDQQRQLHYSKWAKRLRWSLINPDAIEDGFLVFA